jgi:DedD protein
MPPDQSNEQEIQFKKRARRRLVGAIALVLLMVTVLPMVLNDRVAKNPQQEIAISIPSQDGGEFDSKVVPVRPIAPEPVAPEPVPVEDVASAKVPPSTKMEASKTVKPISKPEPVVESKPEVVKTTTAQKSAVTLKSLPEKNQKENSNTQGGAFTVQIGVFSDPANVKKLQQKLQTAGYKSYTEQMDTPKGEKIRLRAGPFADRQQADDALVAIKEAGLSGLVVANK